jgi:hypothetical protein
MGVQGQAGELAEKLRTARATLDAKVPPAVVSERERFADAASQLVEMLGSAT